MNPEVSIIIPNYNGKHLLEMNLYSVLEAAHSFGSAEVIVVDDASSDGSVEWLASIDCAYLRIVRIERNSGFAEACRAGAVEALGEIIYFLNSDIRTDEHFLTPLVPNFNDPNVFAVASMAYDGAGVNIVSSRSGIKWKWGMPDVDRDARFDAPSSFPTFTLFASGGHSAYRKSMFFEIGCFDSLYSPFYWEDVDLGYRAWKRGWKVLFDPNSVVYHDHQGTIGNIRRSRVLSIMRRNRFLFTWKNIKEPGLLALHIAMLPFFIAFGAVAGRKGIASGFLKALSSLPAAISSRKRCGREPRILKDSEILKMFKNPSENLGAPRAVNVSFHKKESQNKN
jgi:GT2 family glycosyltransferase